MKCPKCAGEFEKVDFRGVEVDRCEVCKGIFFDFAEDEELRGMFGSEGIDTGYEEIGKQMDEITNVPCPSCNAVMLTLRDQEQDHVSFEVCPKCYGVFLDAGEFRDLKDFTFLEQLKALVKQFLEGK